MNSREAAEKVAKLRRLAESTANPHEAAAARAQAEKLCQDHHLSDADLQTGSMAAAFDDLAEEVRKIVASTAAPVADLFDTGNIVNQVMKQIRDIPEAEKSRGLKIVTTVIRTAAFVAGDHPVVQKCKVALDTALKNHNLLL